MHEVERERFEEMLVRAISDLPDEFRDRIANVDFAVEDYARPDDYARTGTSRNSMILGVYRGVPLSRRGSGYNMILPDTIVLFQGPLQRLARDEEDLVARVGHVVRHEVAHYFGISDDRLRELEAY